MRFGWQESICLEMAEREKWWGKREDRRYGWRLAVIICAAVLQGTGGQAYAQEDKAENGGSVILLPI